MKKDTEKLIILLLGQDAESKGEIGRKFFDKGSLDDYRSGSHRYFRPCYQEAINKGLIEEEKKSTGDVGASPTRVQIEWQAVSEWLWKKTEANPTSEQIEMLAAELEKSRELVFDMDAFEKFYWINQEYRFPSLGGFIHTAMGYISVLQAFLEAVDRDLNAEVNDVQEKISGRMNAANVRFLVRRVFKTDFDIDNEEFREREKRFLQAQIDEISSLEEVDWPDFSEYFMHLQEPIENIEVSETTTKTTYLPLYRGIRVPLKEEDERIMNPAQNKNDFEVFKSPFELKDFEKWLDLLNFFR